MNKALIVVDTQPDFLPGGPLGVPDGDQTIPVNVERMEHADVIVLTQDWHPENHSSFSTEPTYEDGSWPWHGVQGTTGADIDLQIAIAAIGSGKPTLLVRKGQDANREAYSAFDGTVHATWNPWNMSQTALAERSSDLDGATLAQALHRLSVTEVEVVGLALDYCVKATAIDARSHFGNTSVYLNGTRPVAFLTGALAVAELASKGVRIKGE